MLLDTQVLIWYAANDPRLSATAAALMRTQGHQYSLASLWEAAIKSGLGKLRLSRAGKRVSAGNFFRYVGERLRLEPLPITAGVTEAVEFMPLHHNDLFDRILIAQAMERNVEIVSADAIFDRYGVKRVW